MNEAPRKLAARPSSPPVAKNRLGLTAGVTGLAALLLFGLLAASHFWPISGHTSTSPPESNAAQQPSANLNGAEASPSSAPDPSSLTHTPFAPGPSHLANSARSHPQPVPAALGPAPQQLIAQLALVDLSRGPLTTAQAQQLKQNLQQLVAEGAAAVPAIRNFLEQPKDLNFGDEGARLAGFPTLRAGLLDALGQIGGPDALDLSRQLLKTSSDPLEVALLARSLQQTDPGQSPDEVLSAARQTLALAAEGKLPGKDLAPIFQALQTYGDTSVATELQNQAGNWKYYATMALAGMPAGQGIPSLIKLAQDMPSDPNQYNKLPLQMLAQLSSQYPDASSALLDMNRQNQIPDSAWRAVAAGFGGNQYQFTRLLPQNTPPPGSSIESGTSTIGGPAETFYSMPISSSAQDISQRLALIDQLLAANASNPAAVAALNQARTRLTGGGK